jgi:hypothetical protein
MKVTGHIPLRFIHANRASFTLPIQRKAIQPHLFPFSSKKVFTKVPHEERERQPS